MICNSLLCNERWHNYRFNFHLINWSLERKSKNYPLLYTVLKLNTLRWKDENNVLVRGKTKILSVWVFSKGSPNMNRFVHATLWVHQWLFLSCWILPRFIHTIARSLYHLWFHCLLFCFCFIHLNDKAYSTEFYAPIAERTLKLNYLFI